MQKYEVVILGNILELGVENIGGGFRFTGDRERILPAWKEYLKEGLAGKLWKDSGPKFYLRPCDDRLGNEQYPYTMIVRREFYCLSFQSEKKLYKDFVEWLEEGMTERGKGNEETD
jgi:hypothetical protein